MSERSNRRRKLPQWMLSLVSSNTETTRDSDNNQFDANCDVESEDNDIEELSNLDRANTVMYMMSEQELLHIAMKTLHTENEDLRSDETLTTKPTKICFRNKTLVNFQSSSHWNQVNSVAINDNSIDDNDSEDNQRRVDTRRPHMKIESHKKINDSVKNKKLKTKTPKTSVNIHQIRKDTEPVPPDTLSGHSHQKTTGTILTNRDIETDQMATNKDIHINNKQWTDENIQKDKNGSTLPFTIFSSRETISRQKPDLSILDEIFL
ncbi:uncharacterized protein LOC106877878 [Octopus bimaculoides]|uniref:Uncharacterized protein n=1 Tax=Octopus bimaculoides TaxID=37653 RepID=A0A0L8IA74_OCTBM|nr:uncharacterized protein LOC106877878 [Octopus bimaculoides]XP_014782416.1 uncharacterized protein LOC106877878 [Octopus bimaculoides]XP_014782425.1 uncharacterized protein LOC106877878 [Octopus bimaculoides]XP_014782429.1 uncharacterized protein LOC106877878 [Octopus bimaculoides]|eukprot:XP_014782409.1 PREDICTED: uncharacterized protein LOC106877878 [Octopus bimaculoides]